MRRLLLFALLSGCALPGCTLVDQTTFNREAGTPPVIPPAPVVAAPAPAPSGPPPLVTLRLAQAGDYQAALRQAVGLARARKPGVTFDVTEIVAPGAEAGAGRDAAAVAQGIVALGVAPRNVNLAARVEAGAAGREVRVYVR